MAEHIVMAASNEPSHEHILVVQMCFCDLYVVQTTRFWLLNLLLSSIIDPYYSVCHKYCYDVKCCNTFACDIRISLAAQLLTCVSCDVTMLLEFCSCIIMLFHFVDCASGDIFCCYCIYDKVTDIL
jgi:hypothetical protein